MKVKEGREKGEEEKKQDKSYWKTRGKAEKEMRVQRKSEDGKREDSKCG